LKPWLIAVMILAALALIMILVECIYELYAVVLTEYKISSVKVAENDRLRAVFVSDLHGRKYNGRLIRLIRKAAPDVILIGGDLTVARYERKDRSAIQFLSDIRDIAPIYYAPGNHEKTMQSLKMYEERYRSYRETTDRLGIIWLANGSEKLNGSIRLTGLDADYDYYMKVHPRKIEPGDVEKAVGRSDESSYNIILAHSPDFFEESAAAGYDLVLSGHYHGGAVRLPRLGGVISPQFRLFPKYSRGRFEQDGALLIVSAGCGSHTVNLRLHNKPEALLIDLASGED